MSIAERTIIVSTAATHLAEHGFHYDETASTGQMWVFRRTSGPSDQFFTFTRYQGTLDVQLHTSFATPTTASNLANVDRWSYANRADLRGVLQQILGVLIEKGLAWLEKYSRRLPLMPSDVGKRLQHEHLGIAQKFAIVEGVSLDLPSHLLVVGQRLIDQRIRLGVENPDWMWILGAAAYYGEILSRKSSSEWQWNDVMNYPLLLIRASSRLVTIDVVRSVVGAWAHEDQHDYLYDCYTRLHKVYDI